MSAPRSLLRQTLGGHAPVGYAELFFDLVYVFTITQLSHFLLEHHGLTGVLQASVLFLAIWWAWVWMTWSTNWLDPDRAPVRLMIFLVMLAGLAMSSSIPKAFGPAGLVFALACVGPQILRTAFVAAAMRERPETSRNLWRAVIWMIASLPLWVIGALAEPDMRLLWWAAAIAVNLGAPFAGFWVPGLGASRTTDFGVSGGHMAERCALFIIIALGEGIVVTGATFAEMTWDSATVAAFITAFAGSVAMWWVYFDRGARRGAEHIEHHQDSGRVARNAYTYLHIPIVAGIILTAVGDEMLLAHPAGHIEPIFIAGAVGGPALFLAGCMFFKRAIGSTQGLPLSHLVGLALFAAVAAWGLWGHPTPLAIGIATVVVMAIVAVWEWRSFNGGWTRSPAPGATA